MGTSAQPDQDIKKAPTRGAHSLTSTNPAADAAAFLISFRKFLLATAVSKSLVEKFWAIMSQVNGYESRLFISSQNCFTVSQMYMSRLVKSSIERCPFTTRVH